MDLLLKNYIKVFGVEIYFYAIIIVLGMIIATVVCAVLCHRRGIKYDVVLDFLLAVIPLAIIGARAYYVIFNFKEFDTFLEMINIRSGGLAIYGGIIGGAIAVAIVCRVKKIDFLKFADCAAVALILGQAIGRWGNFINGEAYGNIVTDPTRYGLPWSVLVDGVYYQATFFYESAWNIIGFIGLFIAAWFYRYRINGLVMCAYFAWYGLGRAIIEGLRSDSLYIGSTGIRVSQALSVCLMIFGVIFGAYLIIKYRKSRKQITENIEE